MRGIIVFIIILTVYTLKNAAIHTSIIVAPCYCLFWTTCKALLLKKICVVVTTFAIRSSRSIASLADGLTFFTLSITLINVLSSFWATN